MSTWKDTGREAQPDSKHRISLGMDIQTPPGVRYRVMQNDHGQILLDPVITVPVREAWIYENPAHLESIKRGIAQAEAGKLKTIKLPPDEE